jgi:hypothetical protein
MPIRDPIPMPIDRWWHGTVDVPSHTLLHPRRYNPFGPMARAASKSIGFGRRGKSDFIICGRRFLSGSTSGGYIKGLPAFPPIAASPGCARGRGNREGFADPDDYFIAGSNLNGDKGPHAAYGLLPEVRQLPPAKNPVDPTSAELSAIRRAVAAYQEIVDTH